jgi:hypothetical protein
LPPAGGETIPRNPLDDHLAPAGGQNKYRPQILDQDPAPLARTLAVTIRRARLIQEMGRKLLASSGGRPPTQDQADALARNLWTNSPSPNTVATRSSALGVAFLLLTGRPAGGTAWKREARRTRQAKALFCAAQAPPAKEREIREVLRDTRVRHKTRQAIALMWALGLYEPRPADVVKRKGPLVLLRFRGLKGQLSMPTRGRFKWLLCRGLASILLPLFRRDKLAKALAEAPSTPFFRDISRGMAVNALKRVNPKLSAHSVRRGVATHLANRGWSMERLALLLGHASPDTTRLYVQPARGQPESKALRRMVRDAVLKRRPSS